MQFGTLPLRNGGLDIIPSILKLASQLRIPHVKFRIGNTWRIRRQTQASRGLARCSVLCLRVGLANAQSSGSHHKDVTGYCTRDHVRGNDDSALARTVFCYGE